MTWTCEVVGHHMRPPYFCRSQALVSHLNHHDERRDREAWESNREHGTLLNKIEGRPEI